MVGYIYCFKHLSNQKVYIGQTVNIVNRLASHKSKSLHIKTKFYNAVRKYGWDMFEFSVLETVTASSLVELNTKLDQLEIFYIEKYNSYYKGYNSTLGGSSKRGYQLSDNFKEKCRNRRHSDESKSKMSKSASGRKASDSTKQKLREAAIKGNSIQYLKGHEEKRLQNCRLAKNKPVLQYSQQGQLIVQWESLTQAADYIHKHLSPELSFRGALKSLHRHCTGETKKNIYKGFIWKYKSDV